MIFSAKISGIKETTEALKRLPAATTRPAVARGMNKALQPVRDAMASAAPVKTGLYRSRFTVSRKLSNKEWRKLKKDRTIAISMFAGAANPLSHLLEDGTKHRYQKSTGRYTGRGPRIPHVRPAWSGQKDRLLSEVGDVIWKEIQKVAGNK